MAAVSDLPSRVESVLDIPLHRFLGLRLADPAEPSAGVLLDVGEPALNNAGVLHGGIVTALLDVACYLALLPSLAPDENAVTHDVAASLLRPVSPGAVLRLTAQVVRKGRAVVFLRAEGSVDGLVVATAQVTKTMVRSSGAAAAGTTGA